MLTFAGSEDLFEAMPGNYYSRHSLGMLGQGILMFLMMRFSGHDGHLGHYYIQVTPTPTPIRTLAFTPLPTLTPPSAIF